MASALQKLASRPGMLMLLADALALTVFYHIMPGLRRPFEILLLLTAVLGIVTAAAVRRNAVRCTAVAVASLALCLFAAEMAERFFGITSLTAARPSSEWRAGRGSPYSWRVGDPAEYLAVLDTARRDGVEPEALADHFAGDVFAGTDRGKLVTTRRENGGLMVTTEGYKRFYLTNTPLGYEHAPDNLVREYGTAASGRFVFDVLYKTDAFGFRETRGSADAGDVHVFIGDSFTFGAFVNGDETLPHYFSELLGFDAGVYNLGVMGWGPHHVLRTLELDRLAPAVPDPAAVKGVYYSLIDTHANRAAGLSPKYMTEPFYVLEDGRLLFRARNQVGGGFTDRLAAMMQKSRIYPVLRERLALAFGNEGKEQYKWRLTAAILAEIDRLCRERYGVPLTVIYWDENRAAAEMIREAGLGLLLVDDAFEEGADWRKMAVKYLVYDTHPSAYGYKKLAEYLHAATINKGG